MLRGRSTSRRSMNEEAGPSENDSDHAQHHSEHPEKSASGKQSDGCDHQSYFKKDFRQVITIGSISLRSDFGLHLSCLILDFLLIVFVACRLAGVFLPQFGQGSRVRRGLNGAVVAEDFILM